jgi:hypothetical protein
MMPRVPIFPRTIAIAAESQISSANRPVRKTSRGGDGLGTGFASIVAASNALAGRTDWVDNPELNAGRRRQDES